MAELDIHTTQRRQQNRGPDFLDVVSIYHDPSMCHVKSMVKSFLISDPMVSIVGMGSYSVKWAQWRCGSPRELLPRNKKAKLACIPMEMLVLLQTFPCTFHVPTPLHCFRPRACVSIRYEKVVETCRADVENNSNCCNFLMGCQTEGVFMGWAGLRLGLINKGGLGLSDRKFKVRSDPI